MDTGLTFGGRSVPGIFHRITQAAKRMMARKGYTLPVVYLDEVFLIGETEEACLKSYNGIYKLFVDLGF